MLIILPHPPQTSFNPSQVGYKHRRAVPGFKRLVRFNPSQVGYKRESTRFGVDCYDRFNPSQVGYKRFVLDTSREMRAVFQSLTGRLQTCPEQH